MNLVPIDGIRHLYHDGVLPLLHKLMPYGDLGPRVEVHQTEAAIVVTAEIPGLQHPEHIKLLVQGTTLTIRGELSRELSTEGENELFYSERIYGKFSRTVPLPVTVDQERAAATYKRGLLIVTLPKCTEPPGTRVAVDFQ
ncbi:Hsp20/alpha crystallin family protein [Tumebacillus lipolyticus]|uniref:Hsp20/alpha crystallin family protein n=1 Tax=Tumebacillus lipolyticus TaxID=1280370 RepID=A0ABW4ZV34_9BACL